MIALERRDPPTAETADGDSGDGLISQQINLRIARNHSFQVIVIEIGPGRYRAQIDGENICSSHQPFLDSARVLLKRGCDPNAVLAMYRPGDAAWSLRASIGRAAGLTVNESRTAFAEWKPFCPAAVSPLVAQHGSAGAEHREAA